MINLLCCGLVSLILTVILGIIFIPLLKKLKAGQTILFYVKEHESKNGTPTMGGLFFIFSAIISFFIFGKSSGIAVVCVAITLAYMSVGFLDDFIKVRSCKNEGLKPYQKIIFQITIGLLAGFFAIKNGLTVFYLPFTDKSVDFGLFSMPLIALVFIATTNSVNLTDGLDGLASSVSSIYLFAISILILLQAKYFSSDYYLFYEYSSIVRLSVAFGFSLLGFLVFNFNKASVFMGDTGSLSLGGLIASVSIFTGNLFYIAIIGITFVISSLSVIIQVIYFKKTRRRVFLMSPFHHHLQHKGLSEGKIAYIYSLVTIIISVFVLLNYLA